MNINLFFLSLTDFCTRKPQEKEGVHWKSRKEVSHTQRCRDSYMYIARGTFSDGNYLFFFLFSLQAENFKRWQFRTSPEAWNERDHQPVCGQNALSLPPRFLMSLGMLSSARGYDLELDRLAVVFCRSLAEQMCKLNQSLLKAKVQITPVRRVIPTQAAAAADKVCYFITHIRTYSLVQYHGTQLWSRIFADFFAVLVLFFPFFSCSNPMG